MNWATYCFFLFTTNWATYLEAKLCTPISVFIVVRGDGYSSFAWTIHLSLVEICDEPNQFQQPMCSHKGAILIGYGATLVVGNYSSFMTELWGIDAAMISFNSLHRQLLGGQLLKRKHHSGL